MKKTVRNYPNSNDSVNNFTQNFYIKVAYKWAKFVWEASHWSLSYNREGAYSSQKGLAPWYGQWRWSYAVVSPLRSSGSFH